MYCEMNHVKEA